MDSEPTTGEAESSWEADVRARLKDPTLLAAELPRLSFLIRSYLADGQPVLNRYIDELFIAALEYGDRRESPVTSHADRRDRVERQALREGVRGTLFLRSSLSDRDDDALPQSSEDMDRVYDSGAPGGVVTEHRRWAGLRYGRAGGRRGQMTRATVAKWGTQFVLAFADRLIIDLQAFLADEEVQADFVDSVIPLSQQSSRFFNATSTTRSHVAGSQRNLRLLSEQLASRLDAPSGSYPGHLTPSRLARELTLSAYTPSVIAEIERLKLYTPASSRHGLPAHDLLRAKRRLVVLGNPGSGKSTVLAAGVVDRVRDGEPAVFVRLSSLAQRLEKPLSLNAATSLVLSIAAEDHGLALGSEELELLAVDLVSEPLAFIALDGLDEIQPQDLEEVWALCKTLEGIAGQVVVSSRLAGYVSLPGLWEEYSVDNLTVQQAARFFDSWFDGESCAGRHRAQVALDSPRQSELMQIPVLLGIVAAVAEDDDVPATEAGLYDRYISLFLRGKWKPRSQWLSPKALPKRLAIARELAWQMATGFTGHPEGARWNDTITLGQIIDRQTTDKPRVAQLLLDRHGLLVTHGRSPSELHQKLRWLHRTVHEHLVGAYLAKIVQGDPDNFQLPDELLMGPPQWNVPLQHMVGFLDIADHRRLFARLTALRSLGDPGYVLVSCSLRLAEALPETSPIRREEAEAHLVRGDWVAVMTLDRELWLHHLPDALGRGDPKALAWAGTFCALPVPPAESYLRFIIELQHNAPRANMQFLACTISWLAANDPDGALDHTVRASLRKEFSPYVWSAGVPSRAAVARAAAAFAKLETSQRFDYLLLLARTGVSLREYQEPNGPLKLQDVRVIEAWAAHVMGESASAPPVPLAVQAILLSGAYGDELAFNVARGLTVGEAAHSLMALPTRLHAAIEELKSLEVCEIDAADVSPAVDLLMTLDELTVLDQQSLLAFVSAAADCVRSCDALSIDWCLRMYWRCWRTYWRMDQSSRRSDRTFALEAIGDAFVAMLVKRAYESRNAVLESNVQDWVSDVKQPIFAAHLIGKLFDAGVFSNDDVVSLVRWAANENYVVLNEINGVRLGARATGIVSRIWAEAPEALAVSKAAVSVQLSELGLLKEWRQRLLEVKKPGLMEI